MKLCAYVLVVLMVALQCSATVEYTAAAVTFVPEWPEGMPADKVMERNVRDYRPWIQDAAKQGADIVVFPEGSNGYLMAIGQDGVYERSQALPFGAFVPHVDDGVPFLNPCLARPHDTFGWGQLRNISCMALESRVTLVVTLIDVQPCHEDEPGCPPDGRFQYNAAVVFSSSGQLLSVFHKNHLSGSSPVLDQPARPPQVHPAVFTAPFGVKFGIFICQDMAFQDSSAMYADLGVYDVIFPTRWSNLLPVVLSAQMDQSWAMIFRSNIIASNQAVAINHSGSGIISYTGEVLASDYNPALANYPSILIGRLSSPPPPPSPSPEPTPAPAPAQPSQDPCKFYGFFPAHCAKISPAAASSGTVSASFEDVTCSATYEIVKASPNETFALMATTMEFNSTHDVDPFYMRTCYLLRCNNYPSCGPYRFATDTVWGSLSLSASGTGFRVPPVPSDGPEQWPSDRIWSVMAVDDGQMVNGGERLQMWNGGRTMQVERLDQTLFAASISGVSPLQPTAA